MLEVELLEQFRLFGSHVVVVGDLLAVLFVLLLLCHQLLLDRLPLALRDLLLLC